MTAEKKPKVSAKQFLADIRSGLDRTELKAKYGLSDKGVDSVFRKMVASGLVTEAEARKRFRKVADPVPGPGKSPEEEPKPPKWRCPACNTAQPEEVGECPACGIVVEKFLARPPEETAARDFGPPTQSILSGYWLLAGGGILGAVLVAGALLLWPEPQVRETLTPSPVPEKIKMAVEQGQKIELEYSPVGFPLDLSVTQGHALHLFETPGVNQGFKKMPPKSGAKRYYDDFKITGRTFRVITEASNPPKIYLDANGNGDLTDDPGPFLGEKPNVMPNHYTLELPYKWEKEPTPYRMWIFASRMGGTAFYPKCHWQGQIVVVSNIYKVFLFDGNSDGDYSNDPAVIDVNNDGKAAKSERLSPGQSLDVSDAVVKLISIAPSGRWVRLDYHSLPR